MVTTSVREEEGLVDAGWTKLQPKLKKLGLANAYLWVHSKTVNRRHTNPCQEAGKLISNHEV
jgi:hypothetical protein